VIEGFEAMGQAACRIEGKISRNVVQNSTEVCGMPKTKEDVMSSLAKMVSKMDDPKFQSKFADYNKTLQFIFTDNDEATCYIVFEGGSATINDGVAEGAELEITTTTESIMAIMAGTLSPTRAFMGGKIKAKGPMNDLIKLQVLMK
jgi:putative sterol carrier protein